MFPVPYITRFISLTTSLLAVVVQADAGDRPASSGGPSGVPTAQPAPVLEMEPASPPPSHAKLFRAVKRWATCALSAVVASVSHTL